MNETCIITAHEFRCSSETVGGNHRLMKSMNARSGVGRWRRPG
jgi:hypothetical protein